MSVEQKPIGLDFQTVKADKMSPQPPNFSGENLLPPSGDIFKAPQSGDNLVVAEAMWELPRLIINRDRKQIEVNGNPVRIRRNNILGWKVLLLLAERGEGGLSTEAIENVLREEDAERAKNFMVGNIVGGLRETLERGPGGSRLIVTEGTKKAIYRLKAEVEFTEEDLVAKRKRLEGEKPKKAESKPLQGRENDLGERQVRIGHAAFDVNREGRGFKNTSVAEIFRDAFSDILSKLGEDRGSARRKTNYAAGFKSGLYILMQRIEDAMSKNPHEMPVNMAEFMKWLRSQPEYERATIEDLRAVARREITYEDLVGKGSAAGKMSSSPTEGKGHSEAFSPNGTGETLEKGKFTLTDKELYTFASLFRLAVQESEWIIDSYKIFFSQKEKTEAAMRCNEIMHTIYEEEMAKKGNPNALIAIKREFLQELQRKLISGTKEENPIEFLKENNKNPLFQGVWEYIGRVDEDRLNTFIKQLIYYGVKSLLPRADDGRVSF